MSNKNLNNTDTNKNTNNVPRKIKAKSIGIKSVINTDKSTVVTTFGKGSKAILDKRIDYNSGNVDIQNIYPETKLSMESFGNNTFRVSRDKGSLESYIPKASIADNYDTLQIKKSLEKEVFGRNFDSNLHIQIAYNIFDIIKALVPVASNVCYVVNSLDRGRNKKNEIDDVVGFSINYSIPYSKFGKGDEKYEEKENCFNAYYENAKDQFAYFSDVFYKTDNSKNNKYNKNNKKHKTEKLVCKSKREVYNILCVVNFLRNNISHYRKGNVIFKKKYDECQHLNDTLNSFVKKAIAKVNQNFINNEKNNLYLITQAFSGERIDKSVIIKELYDYSVKKSNLNLGFNLRRLREIAIEKGYIDLSIFAEQKLNTFRSKLYKIIDVVTIHYLKERKGFTENLVESLRRTETEEEKEAVYQKFAEELLGKNKNKKYNHPKLGEYYTNIINSFSEKEYDDKKFNIEITEDDISGIMVNAENLHIFSKLMYAISRFLDGKEINILLSTLISKFQDIDAQNEIYRKLQKENEFEEVSYCENFGIFEDSKRIAEELNIIKSISKMNKSVEGLPLKNLYKDALRSLNVKEEKLENTYNTYFTGQSKTKISSFICNNVLKSNRFIYVCKYINPSDIPAIMGNKAVKSFIFNEIPDAQIVRYYKAVEPTANADTDIRIMRKTVFDAISNISFDSIAVKEVFKSKKGKLTPTEICKRESKKAVLRLYFTIAYIFVKNMVNVNSRYILGFYFLERDRQLVDYPGINEKIKYNFDCLTRLYTGVVKSDIKQIKKSEADKIKRYISKSNTDFSKKYDFLYNTTRNLVDHINVISNLSKYIKDKDKGKVTSYFAIYHYILQNMVISKVLNHSKSNSTASKKMLKSLLRKYEKDGKYSIEEYSRPLLKAMMIPFAYNLPRYKNLTTEKYFDKNSNNP